MQLNDARNADNRQKQKSEENKLELVKKKPSLLKKKKLPPTKLFSNIDLKHVINIGDVCFINQDSLRYPEQSEETLLKALYSYKMISKVTLNNSYLNIQLKKNNENLLPPQYFIQRLKSFGDEQLSNIASHLQIIHRQFSLIKDSCQIQRNSFLKDKEESSLLQDFLQQMQGKKYFVYFSQISPQRTNMKNIVFSVPLLKALGCNLKNIVMDYLKYKQVFFQVFTTKMYRFFLDKCLQNFGKIQALLMVRPDMTQEQKQEITSFIYDDEVIRTKEGPEGIYEEISHAKVRWFSPHPSICCFEILQLDDGEGIKVPKLRKINHFEKTKTEQQIQELKNIGINFQLLTIQDESEKRHQLALQNDNLKLRNEVHHHHFNSNHYSSLLVVPDKTVQNNFFQNCSVGMTVSE